MEGFPRSIGLWFVFLLAFAGCDRNSELQDFTSDGCSLFPDGTLMGKDEWCECCFEHDIAYWQGGTEEERLLADLALRECVLEKTGSEELAELMFQGVRAGGSPYFYNWYRWGYGWSDGRNYQELSAAEKDLVELKLEKFFNNPSFPCENQLDNSTVENSEETPVYPASNLQQDTYGPGDGWNLVWADEFEGDELDESNWSHQVLPAGQFNKEWQAYTGSDENACLEDGCLVIKAAHKGGEHGHDQYSSARINTAGKQAWTYGKIVARAQLPHGMGMWPAFWMLGANCDENGGDTPWPFCGEIDIFEMYGSKSDAIAEANIHFANADGDHEQLEPPKFELPEAKFADAFHVFEIEWDEKAITWRIDGQSYGSVDITTADKQEFHKLHFILLNVAVGGAWAGRPDDTTPFPQFMYVDWVRVYQK